MTKHEGWTPVEIKNGKRHISCEERSRRFSPGEYCAAPSCCELEQHWQSNPDTNIQAQQNKVQQLRIEIATLQRALEQEEKILAGQLSHQEFLRRQEATACEYRRFYRDDYPKTALSPDWHAYELDNWHR